MSEGSLSPLHMLVLSSLCLGLTLFHLIPLGIGSGARVLPDAMLALLACWSVRRPQDLPLVLLAGLLLMADFLLARPVGLWALMSLLILEVLGGQREAMRDRSFVFEWGSFALALAAGLMLQSLILQLALVERPAGTLTLRMFAVTVAAYPVVTVLLHYVLRVRSPKPVERSRRLGRVS